MSQVGAAQFGYAVETLATQLLGIAAAGWALSYQVASGNNRPDIVATKYDRTVWLNLTAGSPVSAAHIYRLEGWHDVSGCPSPHVEIVDDQYSPARLDAMPDNAELEQADKPKATERCARTATPGR